MCVYVCVCVCVRLTLDNAQGWYAIKYQQTKSSNFIQIWLNEGISDLQFGRTDDRVRISI